MSAASRLSTLAEISAEMESQHDRWGVQDHPCVDAVLTGRDGGCTPDRMCEEYGIPSEARAKQSCETAFARGQGTWAHIAVEELSEAVSARTEAARRAELVQLAAVVASWIEAIDRR